MTYLFPLSLASSVPRPYNFLHVSALQCFLGSLRFDRLVVEKEMFYLRRAAQ